MYCLNVDLVFESGRIRHYTFKDDDLVYLSRMIPTFTDYAKDVTAAQIFFHICGIPTNQ